MGLLAKCLYSLGFVEAHTGFGKHVVQPLMTLLLGSQYVEQDKSNCDHILCCLQCLCFVLFLSAGGVLFQHRFLHVRLVCLSEHSA